MQKLVKTMMITLLTAASATLSAAPVGYSINADSFTSEPDSLYRIELSTGAILQNLGIVQLAPLPSGRRMDVEGLAFAPDGTLYGIDDESLTLFRINPANALVDPDRNYTNTGAVLTPKDNDFGMTFACDGSLYISSVTKQSLYKVELNGTNKTWTPTLIGSPGSLKTKVGALAAFGNPTKLYGLSNGALGAFAVGPPHLLEINPTTGVTTDLGLLLGSFRPFAEAGLAFGDTENDLWAMTDTSPNAEPSQVLRINVATRTVTETLTTAETGFESLAIAPPGGCISIDPDAFATFIVQKQYEDGNNITPVTFHFKCTSGNITPSSKTIYPEEDGFGPYQVGFTVSNLPAAEIECEIREEPIPGYTPQYSCESDASCSTNEGVSPCLFQSVRAGQSGVCQVLNQLDPVELTVAKEWLYERSDTVGSDNAEIDLYCSDVVDGDGEFTGNIMRWSWEFFGNKDSHIANVYPDFDGDTECWTEERTQLSAIESESTCEAPISIAVGDDKRSCEVTNTVFFEGIPTLSPYGLALISALMLLTGLISVRRIV